LSRKQKKKRERAAEQQKRAGKEWTRRELKEEHGRTWK